VTFDEALDKAKLGVKILIREGSAAKNYEALHPLIKMHPDKVMFCSDDKHPHELVKGHINELVKRSVVEHGYDLMDVLRAASLNPALHYKLDVGLLQAGDHADFIIVDNLKDFNVIETYIKGLLIAQHGITFIESVEAHSLNNFHIVPKKLEDFALPVDTPKIHVIQALDGELVTRSSIAAAKIENNTYVSDTQRDILKLTVVNRYDGSKPAIAFIQNFGLKKGAIASCIAHDSHNIIAVGCSDAEILKAVNCLIEHKGGISVMNGEEQHVLPLPVAGLMSLDEGHFVAKKYAEMDKLAKDLGTHLYAPFMTLSFMALLVIPELKLSDKGLFDGKKFKLIPLPV
jgi:adenine deaminase